MEIGKSKSLELKLYQRHERKDTLLIKFRCNEVNIY